MFTCRKLNKILAKPLNDASKHWLKAAAVNRQLLIHCSPSVADDGRNNRNRKFVNRRNLQTRRTCKAPTQVQWISPNLKMSSLPSLESIYGSLTADITANTAKLERLGNQTDTVEDEFEEGDSAEKSEESIILKSPTAHS